MPSLNAEKLIQIVEKLIETDRHCPACQASGGLKLHAATADQHILKANCEQCGALVELDLNTLALKRLISSF